MKPTEIMSSKNIMVPSISVIERIILGTWLVNSTKTYNFIDMTMLIDKVSQIVS